MTAEEHCNDWYPPLPKTLEESDAAWSAAVAEVDHLIASWGEPYYRIEEVSGKPPRLKFCGT
jgi:hypothetical protein